jgi:hypothetical protein
MYRSHWGGAVDGVWTDVFIEVGFPQGDGEIVEVSVGRDSALVTKLVAIPYGPNDSYTYSEILRHEVEVRRLYLREVARKINEEAAEDLAIRRAGIR